MPLIRKIKFGNKDFQIEYIKIMPKPALLLTAANALLSGKQTKKQQQQQQKTRASLRVHIFL